MQSRRLVVTGIELDHTIQRLHEEMSLGNAEFIPDEIFIELETTATASVYIGWDDADGTKPADLTSANGLPLVAGQQRTIKTPDAWPRADFRHLCFKGDAADDGVIVTVSYWAIIDSLNPS